MAAKKTAAKKSATKKSAKKKSAAKKSGKAAKKSSASSKGGEGVRAESVNMGHVFALRPRVSASFRPDDFREAKERLRDESYASASEAARAVADKALSLTHESSQRSGRSRK